MLREYIYTLSGSNFRTFLLQVFECLCVEHSTSHLSGDSKPDAMLREHVIKAIHILFTQPCYIKSSGTNRLSKNADMANLESEACDIRIINM